MPRRARLPAALLSVAIVAAALGGCAGAAAEPPQIDGVLPPGDATWRSAVTLRGDHELAVQSGSTLHIHGAKVGPPSPGAGTLTLRVGDGGTLDVEAARLVAVRILLEPGGAARIDGATLDQAAGGIHAVQATLALRGSTLRGSPEFALSVEGGAATLSKTILEGSGGLMPAAHAFNATLTIDRSTVAGSDGYGIQVRDSTLWMNESAVQGTADYGLQAASSTVFLRGNRWESHCGIFLQESTAATIEGERFASVGHGLSALDSGPVEVRSSTFLQASTPIHAEHSDLLLDGGTFASGEVSLEDSHAVLKRNWMGDAVVTARGAEAFLRNNTWLAGAGLAVRSLDDAQVDAAWNWWGTSQGPPSSRLEGAVRVEPWLDQAP